MIEDIPEARFEAKTDASWLSRRAAPRFDYLALFYAAYVLAGGFGQGLALIPGISITFWPPAGIFVATLLLTPRQSWPWWIFAGCLAELTCNAIWFHSTIPLALIYFSANALVALTAAGLIRLLLHKPFRLESLEEVAAFVTLGAGVAPMVSASLIAATDALTGKHPFWTAWPLVWLGDATGLLVSAPLTLVAVQVWRNRANHEWLRIVEAAGLMALLLGVSVLSFRDYLPTPYLALPPMMWIAVRFQIKGAAVSLAMLAIMEALLAATSESAAAGQAEPMREKIVSLQTFLGIAAISSLLVAVMSLLHQRALHLVKGANAELETRVRERTAALQASERRLELASEAGGLGVYEYNVVTGRGTWSASLWHLLGLESEGEVPLERAVEQVHPDDRERVRAEMEDVMRKLGPYQMEYRIRKPDGAVLWVADRGEAAGPVDDATGRVAFVRGTLLDITGRKRHEDHQRMLINELNHRVKNTLATIQSMASQTLRSSPSLAEAKTRFEARLLSLSQAHDILTREKWDSAPLADIVDRAIGPYSGSKHQRFSVSGPDVRISAQTALAFGMTLHELCTNAVKYGALSKETGKVTITWNVSSPKKDTRTLTFRWQEKGGPPVAPPSSRGFGTKLIERGLAGDLGGDVKITFAKSGVTCVVVGQLQNAGQRGILQHDNTTATRVP